MGLENKSFSKSETHAQSPNRAEHPVLGRMHFKAQEILQEGAIDPVRFTDLYGTENITRDLRKVETLKASFLNNESKSAAEIFEALVYTHTELSDWLGPNAETIRTSEYDDIVNGVDLVIEFNEDNSARHLALGVDVTFGSLSMQRKFDRIKTEIEKDELAVVKYFESHGYKGSLRQLPRVVIGVELNKVVQLAGLWERGDNKTLGGHIAKDIIALEIERQLRTYLVYAQSIHSENAVKSYLRALNTVRNVRTLRNGFSDTATTRHLVEEDRVFQGVVQNLERFKISSPRQ